MHPSRNPTPAQYAEAVTLLRDLATTLGYPVVPATGHLAHGWETAVAARLGVERSSVSKVWSGARVMPAGWRERALPAQGRAP